MCIFSSNFSKLDCSIDFFSKIVLINFWPSICNFWDKFAFFSIRQSIFSLLKSFSNDSSFIFLNSSHKFSNCSNFVFLNSVYRASKEAFSSSCSFRLKKTFLQLIKSSKNFGTLVVWLTRLFLSLLTAWDLFFYLLML